MNNSNIHQSMLQYHENIHEYNENMRRFLQFMNDNPSNVQPTPPSATSRNILIRLIQNILRNRIQQQEETFEDVTIMPTLEQINNATETIIYNENDNYMNTSCPISLDVFRVGDDLCRIKYCSHLFKKNALMRWFQVNVVCPVCRYDIRNYENETSYPIVRNNLSNAIRSILNHDYYNDYEYFTLNIPINDLSGNF